jgi:hypothetical protein
MRVISAGSSMLLDATHLSYRPIKCSAFAGLDEKSSSNIVMLCHSLHDRFHVSSLLSPAFVNSLLLVCLAELFPERLCISLRM